MRGRVMSFFIMAFLGGAPLGSLFFGALAERIGIRAAFASGGLLCFIAGFFYLRGIAPIRASVALVTSSRETFKAR